MTPPIIEANYFGSGVVAAGRRLIGHYCPSAEVTALSLSVSAGTLNPFTLGVWIDGQRVAQMPIEGPASLPLAMTVAAGQTLRISVEATDASPPVDVMVKVSLRSGGSQAAAARVEWVNGAERTVLYLVENGVWTAVDSALLAGRASIASDGETVQVGSEVWLSAGDDGITVTGISNRPCTASPRLEFYVGEMLMGALSSESFCTRAFKEVDTPPSAAIRFAHQGTVRGALDFSAFWATEIHT
jgi:hypothetical protein